MDPYVERTQLWINTTYGTNPNTPDIGPVTVDGYTGWETVTALVRALQFELGIASRSDTFGPTTLSLLTAKGVINNSTTNKNFIRIAQGAMYCKGYQGGNGTISGVWDAAAITGMKTLRGDMGLTTGNGDIEPKVYKALLNMDAFMLVAGGTSVVRTIQQALNGRYLNRQDFYVVPTDGRYTGDVQSALIYAIQYELGLADGVANGHFGPTTKSKLASQAAISAGSTDGSKYYVHLFQAALIFNGYSVSFDGAFGSGTQAQTKAFQQFVALPQSGTANVQTWGSLLVSYGDDDRPGVGADCITTLTAERLAALRSAGYTHFGRYLTNTPDNDPDKCLKNGELQRIFNAGGRVFPLFQTGGGNIAHFTSARGREVGEEAASAAWAYRIPANTIIYFSVDFDATDEEIQDAVIPYFQALPERLGRMGRTYRIGVYAPRRVCHKLNAAGLVASTFVSDMSADFGSNKAEVLPSNWAFDQIQTKWVGSGTGMIEIDKNVVSGRDAGFNTLTAAWGAGNDPLIPSARLDAFEAEWYRECFEHEDSLAQQGQMALNRSNVKARVWARDGYVTQLASELGCYKALIMTPLIWEGMVINPLDALADTAVMAFYEAKRNGVAPPAGSVSDSSTGVCQVKAETGIRAINWAVDWGLLSSRKYDSSVWQDVLAIWQSLHNDEEFCIKVAALTMMMEATRPSGVTPFELRTITPSQVMAMCFGYNGVNEDAMKYGRKRMNLYYTIQRWEESFR